MDFFAPEPVQQIPRGQFATPWKIVIADDEQEVHSVTRMVLNDYQFGGQNLEFHSTYSAAETRELLQGGEDFAVILLDVVMETETAGLELVQWIREELQNSFIRIILRTGQPGYAPETQVVLNYDINDYKEKTELTSQKLFTTITSAIRGYRDLKVIDRNRKGLRQIVQSTANIFELTSLKSFTNGVLTQLTSLLNFDDSSLLVQTSGLAVREEHGEFHVLAATGEYGACDESDSCIPAAVRRLFERGVREKQSFFEKDAFIGYYRTQNGSENLLYLKGRHQLRELDRQLIQIFSSNITIAFDKVYLNLDLEETQRELIQTLGEVVENRHSETGQHVVRVAEVSYCLAKAMGVDEEEAKQIREAAPMHDIGKITIPEEILFKTGPLSPEEFELVKTHTSEGRRMLSHTKRRTLHKAAEIALNHHENWDGSGYPGGLRGEEIPLAAQIVGLADAVDALSHERAYAGAWPFESICDAIAQSKGSRFSPRLVAAFESCKDEIAEIVATP